MLPITANSINNRVIVSGGTDWRTLLAKYLEQKEVGSKATLTTYRKALTHYFEWVCGTGRNLGTMTKADVLAYRDGLLEHGCTTRSVALYISAVRGFYDWVEEETRGLYPNIAKVRVKKSPGNVKYHLVKEKRAELLRYYRERKINGHYGGDAVNLRDYAIVNLMLRCGLRTREVQDLDLGDIDWIDGRRILRIRGKGRRDKDRWVVLLDGTYGPIEEYLATRPAALESDPLFAGEGRNSRGRRLAARTVQYICKEGLKAVGLTSKRYSPHSLRHTTGVVMLQNGGSLTDVQDVLGHASIDTTRIYVESAKREMRLTSPAERFADDIL